MPELPEIEAYLHALRPRIGGEVLERVRIASVSVLKTVDPTPDELAGRRVTTLTRLGKRIAVGVEGDLYAVLHLMVAGRLKWLDRDARIPKRYGQAAIDFSSGTLLLTEAGSRRRASLHVVRGADALAALDAGGIEVADATLDAFRAALLTERHTLKRALTDPRYLAGIGGAFADEILHRARLSPLQLNTNLDDAEIEALWRASRDVLAEWTERRIAETGDGFPKEITAFHPAMAVHGRHGQPCPVCGAPVQRIVYADRETNYCPRCQTGGRILADRALSRLLKDAFPATIDDLEG